MPDRSTATTLALLTPEERRAFLALPEPEQQAALRWIYGESDLDGLTSDIARLRAQAYLQRLTEIGQRIGLRPGPLDSAVQRDIAEAAARSATSIVQTHNGDLLRFLGNLKPDSDWQREIAAWERARADWKSRSIAVTEAMGARNQADTDFRRENRVTVQVRVVPETAQCSICADNVSLGLMSLNEADGIDINPHPNCIHGWEYATDLSDSVATDSDLWLGSAVSREAA